MVTDMVEQVTLQSSLRAKHVSESIKLAGDDLDLAIIQYL